MLENRFKYVFSIDKDDYITKNLFVSAFRSFFIVIIMVYMIVFVVNRYKLYAEIIRIFWHTKENYFVKKIELLRIFYQEQLYNRIICPNVSIAKFFNVDNQVKKKVDDNVLKNIKISSTRSLDNKQKIELKVSLTETNSETSDRSKKDKIFEQTRKIPKARLMNIILVRWTFLAIFRWLLLFVVMISCYLVNYRVIYQYADKIDIQFHLLKIKSEIAELKGYNNIWIFGGLNTSIVQQEYIQSRTTALNEFNNLLNLLENASFWDSSIDYITQIMNKDISRNDTISNLIIPSNKDSISGATEPFNGVSSGQNVSNSSISQNETWDSRFVYSENFDYYKNADNYIQMNFTNVNRILAKGFKHSFLSFLNMIDYNLIFANKIAKDVDKKSFLCNLEEKIITILFDEIEKAIVINEAMINSLSTTFISLNFLLILIFIIVVSRAILFSYDSQNDWEMTKNNYMKNALNLLSEEEISTNKDLVAIYIVLFKSFGVADNYFD
jgi:hypothetical protein